MEKDTEKNIAQKKSKTKQPALNFKKLPKLNLIYLCI